MHFPSNIDLAAQWRPFDRLAIGYRSQNGELMFAAHSAKSGNRRRRSLLPCRRPCRYGRATYNASVVANGLKSKHHIRTIDRAISVPGAISEDPKDCQRCLPLGRHVVSSLLYCPIRQHRLLGHPRELNRRSEICGSGRKENAPKVRGDRKAAV